MPSTLRTFFPTLVSAVESGATALRDLSGLGSRALRHFGADEDLAELKKLPPVVAVRLDALLCQSFEVAEKATRSTASDMLLSPGEVPYLRVDGVVKRQPQMEAWPVDFGDNEVLAWLRLLARTTKYSDMEYEWGGWRFRMQAQIQYRKGAPALAMSVRRLPNEIPEGHRLPKQFIEAIRCPQGLIIVSGPTGSGKSTTLASVVRSHLPAGGDNTDGLNVLLYEDPIEYRHTSGVHLIQQFELGPDFTNFGDALGKSALRKDPDIIIPGELREPAAVQAALDASDTGHLVISTMHLSTAATVVGRINSLAGIEYADKLSKNLSVVLCQSLVRLKGGGRVAAFEQLFIMPGDRSSLAKGTEVAQPALESRVRSDGFAQGSFSMEHSLAVLVALGRVSEEEAASAAVRPNDWRQNRRQLLEQAKNCTAELFKLYAAPNSSR